MCVVADDICLYDVDGSNDDDGVCSCVQMF